MFRREASPIERFNGFRVVCFRQGRVNLAERRLPSSQVVFAPHLATAGVFLQDGRAAVTEEWLNAEWLRQGAPYVHLPVAQKELLLWGNCLPIQPLPFAGCNDLWEADGKLVIAFKRTCDEHVQAVLTAAFVRERLLAAAHHALERFAPQLKQRPRSIAIRPLRARTLGQCTREGDIFLNVSLHQWPQEVMEETLAHELVHLEYFNHSHAFWRRLSELLPDWLPRTLAHYLS